MKMTYVGSPCGACKFLRRKCVMGCVFAPYFCHDEGASHFAAIHKVFGARNVSKLLAHLPITDRSDAAVTISYEAQARLLDPIYGCVSHIFALQQQVVNLEAQLFFIKEQAAKSVINNSTCIANPNQDFHGEIQSRIFSEISNMVPEFIGNICATNNASPILYSENGIIDPNSLENYAMIQEENLSFSSFEGSSSSLDMQWAIQDTDDLLSVPFGHIPNE